MDTYVACTWVASLVALLFGVFKCRSLAEVLFGLSETDAQLELQEKHYEKIKRKSLYWIAFLGINKNLQIMWKNVVHLFLGLFFFLSFDFDFQDCFWLAIPWLFTKCTPIP